MSYNGVTPDFSIWAKWFIDMGVGREGFLLMGKIILLFIYLMLSSTAHVYGESSVSVHSLIIGTYTSTAPGQSKGIYQIDYHAKQNTFSEKKLLVEQNNPSFLAVSDNLSYLYAVEEQDEGKIHSYRLAGKHALPKSMGQALTRGGWPCYIELHPAGTQLAVANYNFGNLAVFDINSKTGMLTHSPKILQHSGKQGPHKERQKHAHAHWVKWNADGSRLYSIDLGLDKVFVHDVDGNERIKNKPRTALSLPPGSGPRHMAFHPTKPFAYIINELSNTIVTASVNDSGEMTQHSMQSTLPKSFLGDSYASHIAISADGKHLFAANRGHNSIAVFAIKDGILEKRQTISTRGDWPRYFRLVDAGRAMIVANQKSDSLVLFNVDSSGLLSDTGIDVSVPSPTYIGIM